jgi:perosamine synthetase
MATRVRYIKPFIANSVKGVPAAADPEHATEHKRQSDGAASLCREVGGGVDHRNSRLEISTKPRILYTKPSITELEVRYAADAAANGWGDQCYAYIQQFEELFKQHLGVRHAIATSSCTGALHMGLAALGIGPGDEVIMADANWIATASPIVNLGARPIFVDILPESWCIDPERVEAAITPRTKAIVAVHLYGNLCDMNRLLALGEKHGIPVIEDAAEAVGSIYHGKRAGAMGNFGAFSFHGTKTITTGEGGMFVTDDERLFERVLTLSNHGRVRGQSKQFWPEMVGFKFKMSNVQAAIGCAQMERIDELIGRKRTILAAYRERLVDVPGVQMNPEPKGTVHGAWMPTVVFDPDSHVTRDTLQRAFAAENTDARVFFWPLSSLPMFAPVKTNAIAWSVPERAINLPSYHEMSDEDINRVTDVIRRVQIGEWPDRSSAIVPIPRPSMFWDTQAA